MMDLERVYLNLRHKEVERLRKKREAFRREAQAILADHARCEENNIDPDNGNSWLCSACKLPIFSTPFIGSYNVKTDDDGGGSSGRVLLRLHDQCANLPEELTVCDLHPNKPLFLKEEISRPPTCNKCHKKCGTMSYRCADDQHCRTTLDVLCAMTSIKIMHRSHKHRLMVIRAGSANSFICGACGTRHDHQTLSWSDVSYMCNACSFWIHPHCASLPTVILLNDQPNLHPLIVFFSKKRKNHNHPLVLNYSGRHRHNEYCAICRNIIESLGVYSCSKCHYYVHIMCAVSDPHRFKPVRIRDVQLPDVVHLPVPDEHTSVLRHIAGNTATGTTIGSTRSSSRVHEHGLIFHHDDKDHRDRVCNACVQILSAPFYSCSECPNFFLHNCCAHLPRTLTRHPVHDKDHSLSLSKTTTGESSSTDHFIHCCRRRVSDGFSYSCEICDFKLDVLCALMPAGITHDAHSKAHILYSLYEPDKLLLRKYPSRECDCCGHSLEGRLYYGCGTCRDFKIHARCARFPDTVRHRYDRHPFKLITTKSKGSESSSSSTSDDDALAQRLKVLYCEICENEIDNTRWYYGCEECDQSVHIDCIPNLEKLSWQ